jgi:tmRNA-binding protein
MRYLSLSFFFSLFLSLSLCPLFLHPNKTKIHVTCSIFVGEENRDEKRRRKKWKKIKKEEKETMRNSC